jgi:predicted CopG family antitoxin
MPTYTTTVRVSRPTRERLGELKREGESFDQLLARLADHADTDAPPASA